VIAQLRRLAADRTGTPAVDFALTMPALILMTVGVLQLGIGFLANAGLRAGVEAGARYATVYTGQTNTTTCGTISRSGYPTLDQIRSKVTSSVFGLDTSKIGTPTVTLGTSNGECYIEVTATYPIRFNFIVLTTPSFNLSYTRRVWQF
jgi:Flp pilus assembly protein TadG